MKSFTKGRIKRPCLLVGARPSRDAIYMSWSNVKSICPNCAEPVQESWKFCPACETPLTSLVCPRCNFPVKENWKRCPECEVRLICIACNRRIPQGPSGCPACAGSAPENKESEFNIREPVTGMEFLHVPFGSFLMGDTFGEGIENEKPVHEVQLDGFYLGRYPVTQSQWKGLMPDNPSEFQGDFHPVERVSWYEVQEFARKLTQANKGKYTFQLPSEAQWEYAARGGGKQEKYSGGDDIDAVAWYDDNSNGTTHPVGQKTPNGLEIYDMSGNVWEWCRDTYKARAYERHQRKNPVCNEEGPDRVIRGGSWNLDAWSARCARRFSLPADLSGPALGFRLVMML